MVEGNEDKRPTKGSLEKLKIVCWIFPWVLAFVFQAQFVWLGHELAAVRDELLVLKNSTSEGRSLSKRSLGENDKDGARRVSGIDAAHLRGTFPFQKIEKDGKIGPWSLTTPENAPVILKSKNTELEFTSKGLYYIYAQISYLTNQASNSYQIMTHNGTEERESHRVLSTCACQGRSSTGEVSCYTGVTGMFNRGHRVYLHQIEQNRVINHSDGCSFVGVVLLKRAGAKRKA